MNDYSGQERRRHWMFVTRNTEYHCRDGICIIVRDRKTGEILPGHSALGKKMSAGVRYSEEGGIVSISKPGEAHVGEALCFSSGWSDRDVITSPLNAIERPPREIVAQYPGAGP